MDRGKDRYKREFDQHINPSKPLTEGSSVFPDIHDQAAGKENMHHYVAGPLGTLNGHKKAGNIRRGDVVERVSLSYLVIALKHHSTSYTNQHSATVNETQANNAQGPTLEFKPSLCTPREIRPESSNQDRL